ncbi:MAG: hypothetical protein IPL53_22265 [Ignavibacteria bacterium]|nr:hypothetical protein [Ignavibacteria bacterium]
MKFKTSLVITQIIFILIIIFTKDISAQQADTLKTLNPIYMTETQKIDVKHIALDLKFDLAKEMLSELPK